MLRHLTHLTWALTTAIVLFTISLLVDGRDYSFNVGVTTVHAQTLTTCNPNPPFSGPCVGADGWTIFTPSTTNAVGVPATGTCAKSGATYTGTCIFYVADAAHGGNDSNPCFSTPPVQQNFATPCLTPSTVSLSYMRTNFPDWVVTLKGSSFFSASPTTQTVGFSQPNKKGRSCTEPMVFGTYGTGARPLFNIANNDLKPVLWSTSGASTNGSFTAIVGYEIYGFQRDTTQPANFSNVSLASTPELISTNTPINCLWVENNKLTYGSNMIGIIQSSNGAPNNTNIIIRRNVIGHAWGASGAPNCVFISQTDAPFLEENFFDTCGYDPIAGSLNTITYPSGAAATFTWQTSPFYMGWTGAFIECLVTADGITAGTKYFIQNLNVGASSFQLSINSSGTPLLTTTGNTASGTQQCYMTQAAPSEFGHSVYEHDDQPRSTLKPGAFARNIITHDSSGPQWRTGGPLTDNFLAYSGDGLPIANPYTTGAVAGSWNVVTKMVSGGNIPSATAGRTGQGILTQGALQTPQVSITGAVTSGGGVMSVTFNCPTFNAISCPLSAPEVVTTAAISFGLISTHGTIVPGSGYVDSTYSGVPLTGGAGSGATATIVVAGGVVTTVTISNQGINYLVGDTLSASAANLGGSGSGFSVPVATIVGTSLSNIGLALTAAINADAALTAFFGTNTAVNIGGPNGTGAVSLTYFGPQTGNMTMAITGVPPGITASIALSLSTQVVIANNLVFNYDTTDSTGAPGAGITLGGTSQGMQTNNNVGCGWGGLPYQDQSIVNVIAVSSHVGDGTVELQMTGVQPLTLESQNSNAFGQGFVAISGTSFISTTVQGTIWAKVIDAIHLYIPQLLFTNYTASGNPISGTTTLQLAPVIANTQSGNRFETSGNPGCANISNPPANASLITMGAYANSIGLACAPGCGDQDLINAWYGQSKDTWNPALRTCAMNDIGFRAPMNMTLHLGCPTFGGLEPANDNGALLLMTG